MNDGLIIAAAESEVRSLSPAPVRPKFHAAGELSRLVTVLRCLGFDCSYDGGQSLAAALSTALRENRIFLTTRPLESPGRPLILVLLPPPSPPGRPERLSPGVRQSDLDMAREVVRKLSLAPRAAPFTRCLVCNQPLSEVTPPPPDEIPAAVRAAGGAVRRCPGCHRLYWEGSHVKRMKERWVAYCLNPAEPDCAGEFSGD